ncbi:MAG: ParB/RepB/Spo0J family partition protein, partial [Saprospiraceae bacterium]|nr:ParB/RepB/Spo0J family partition protein [Saprospiraceae bacterium]
MAKVSKDELGMGIRALLGNSDKAPPRTAAGIASIAIDQIEANPFQPRTEFDEEALADLAASIKAMGIIQPLTVRRLSANSYQLIAGERRLRASKMAGLSEVPAFVRTADDQQMLEMALVENIQRHDLNAIEVAISYHRLIEECALTHEQ